MAGFTESQYTVMTSFLTGRMTAAQARQQLPTPPKKKAEILRLHVITRKPWRISDGIKHPVYTRVVSEEEMEELWNNKGKKQETSTKTGNS